MTLATLLLLATLVVVSLGAAEGQSSFGRFGDFVNPVGEVAALARGIILDEHGYYQHVQYAPILDYPVPIQDEKAEREHQEQLSRLKQWEAIGQRWEQFEVHRNLTAHVCGGEQTSLSTCEWRAVQPQLGVNTDLDEWMKTVLAYLNRWEVCGGVEGCRAWMIDLCHQSGAYYFFEFIRRRIIRGY